VSRDDAAQTIAALERELHQLRVELASARRSARLCRELLTEALERTRDCPRCNPVPYSEASDGDPPVT
jgi:hypothetical protein